MGQIVFRSPADLAGEPDPVTRVRQAEELAEQAKQLAGEYYRVRREAIAELAEDAPSYADVARRLGLASRGKIADAVAAADRDLFDEALQLLAQPGVSAAHIEAMRGLGVDDLDAKARRVQLAARHLSPGHTLTGEQVGLIGRAARRAAARLARHDS